MNSMWSRLRGGIALLAMGSALGAQQGGLPDTHPGWDDSSPAVPQRAVPATPDVPTIRTGVQLVVQDITVTDAAGRPVTGLTANDFRIFEDGREQTIKNFEEHAPIDPALAEERAAELAHTLPPGTFTNYKAFKSDHTVVFLLNIPQGGCGLLSDALKDYMKRAPPDTPFIMLWLDDRLRMVQDMTTDRDALLLAAFENSKHVGGAPPAAPEDPRFPGWPVAVAHRQIVTTAMNQLERYLGGIPGKKDLVWFTAGLRGQLATIDDPAAVQTYPTNVSVNPDTLELIYTDPNYNPWLFYPPTLPTPKEMKSHPTLDAYLADIRNGLAQSRTNLEIYQGGCSMNNFHIEEQIADIVNRRQRYYTLTYSPTNQNWNGHPRTFSVQMANAALRLEYRRSYVGAPSDAAVQRVPVQTADSAALLRETTGENIGVQTAMGMGTVEPTQIIFEASATPSPGEIKDSGKSPPAAGNFLAAKLRKEGYRDYVVHFRVRAGELKLLTDSNQASYAGKVEFLAVVYDNQGQAVNGKREKASVTFGDLPGPQLEAAEATGDLTIQVPAKGSYFLRLGVHDVAADRVGALEIPVTRIPAPNK